MHRALEKLVSLAKREGVILRQSYLRVAKRAAIMVGRYTHAHQFKRPRRALKFLRTRLGRVIRDIYRKTAGDPALEEKFARLLSLAVRVRGQDQRRRGRKVYALHAPEVECIGPFGKLRRQGPRPLRVRLQGEPRHTGHPAQRRPASSRAKSRDVLHARALHGNPFDGHTLGAAIADLEQITGVETRRIHVDKGYRGHDHSHRFRVWISGQVRRVTKPIRREMKRRAAIEP